MNSLHREDENERGARVQGDRRERGEWFHWKGVLESLLGFEELSRSRPLDGDDKSTCQWVSKDVSDLLARVKVRHPHFEQCSVVPLEHWKSNGKRKRRATRHLSVQRTMCSGWATNTMGR